MPEWVQFFVVENEDTELISDPAVHAQYLSWRYADDKRVLWRELLNPRTQRVPVRVRRRSLDGEEWALAILGHELSELRALFRLFSDGDGSMSFYELRRHIDPNGSANLHTRAWDEADQLVTEWRTSQK